MSGKLRAPIPIFRSFNEAEAKDFYVRYLGFTVLFEHRFEPGFPLYMGLRRDGCELHLSEHHGDATPGASCRIPVDDIEAFLAEITERGHPRMKPGILDQSWGEREIHLLDPFGNRLVVCCSMEP